MAPAQSLAEWVAQRNCDIAWAASWIERATLTRKGTVVHIVVTTVRNDLAQRLHHILGAGGVYGPYSSSGSMQYKVDTKDASQYVISLVWPYLTCTKKNQFVQAGYELREDLGETLTCYEPASNVYLGNQRVTEAELRDLLELPQSNEGPN
jgi:hypothetical protein